MAKVTRSPNYPGFNLGEAIERIRRVYKEEHRHPAEREVIAKDLGYSSLNGASLTTIATLVQYGLLEKAENGLRVSDDAITIIELQPGNPERAAAVYRAAFNPKLFADLHEGFGDRLPSGENLRLWLIRKGFNQKAVDGVIRVYRETLEVVSEEASGYNPSGELLEGEDIQEVKPVMQQSSVTLSPEAHRIFSGSTYQQSPPLDNVTLKQSYKVDEKCEAELFFRGEVTQEAIDTLTEYLKIFRRTLPGKKPAEPPQRLDETVPGGRYIDAQGVTRNANGEPIE